MRMTTRDELEHGMPRSRAVDDETYQAHGPVAYSPGKRRRQNSNRNKRPRRAPPRPQQRLFRNRVASPPHTTREHVRVRRGDCIGGGRVAKCSRQLAWRGHWLTNANYIKHSHSRYSGAYKQQVNFDAEQPSGKLTSAVRAGLRLLVEF